MDASRLTAILMDLITHDQRHPELLEAAVTTLDQSATAEPLVGFVLRDDLSGRRSIVHVTEQTPHARAAS